MDLFGMYDRERKGEISVENLFEIAKILGKDAALAESILEGMHKMKSDYLTADEFRKVITELDTLYLDHSHSPAEAANFLSQNQRIVISIDARVVEAIRILYAHQKRCEADQRYSESQLAFDKIEQIKQKEIQRHQANIQSFQARELEQVDDAQKQQYEEFEKTWEHFMNQFEGAADDSIQKLRDKHFEELLTYQEKLRKESLHAFKASTRLLEMRQKEKALVRLKKYHEADKVKEAADKIEGYERLAKQIEVENTIEKKSENVRQVQQKTLDSLVKKIYKERTQQTKNRIEDTQRLINKNKNLRVELIQKHVLEIQSVTENIRKNLVLLHTGEPSLDIRALTSTTITRRIPSPQPKPHIKSPFQITFKESGDPRSIELHPETGNSIDGTRDEVVYDK